MAKKVYRPRTDKMLGGVCSGLANYFNVDVVLIRLLWVFAFLAGGIGLIAYIAAWIIIPEEGYLLRPDQTTNEEPEAQESPFKSSQGTDRQGQIIVGFIAVFIGVFLLVKQFIPYFPWHNIWPIAIVLVGVGIILGGFSGKSK